jgi:hypothetical protein
MFQRKIVHALLSATFACGALLACAGDPASLSPRTAPDGGAAAIKGGVVPAHANSGKNFHATTCETRTSEVDSGVFGPDGGTLLFGTSRLIIPAGALTDTITISATMVEGFDSRVEFQPHGLQFLKPAGLLLNTSGCSIDPSVVPDVVYLSESGEILETIPATYDPHWHTLAAAIQHFSGYAIAF